VRGGGFATIIRSLGGEGVRLRAYADVVMDELDTPASAGLFDDILSCRGDYRESEGDNRGSKFVQLENHGVGIMGAGYFAGDSHVWGMGEMAWDDLALHVARSIGEVGVGGEKGVSGCYERVNVHRRCPSEIMRGWLRVGFGLGVGRGLGMDLVGVMGVVILMGGSIGAVHVGGLVVGGGGLVHGVNCWKRDVFG
jgi:hypothetical protein